MFIMLPAIKSTLTVMLTKGAGTMPSANIARALFAVLLFATVTTAAMPVIIDKMASAIKIKAAPALPAVVNHSEASCQYGG